MGYAQRNKHIVVHMTRIVSDILLTSAFVIGGSMIKSVIEIFKFMAVVHGPETLQFSSLNVINNGGISSTSEGECRLLPV